MMHVLQGLVIGLGATMCIDAWALLLRRAFGSRSLDFCLLGRWAMQLPQGTFVLGDTTAAARRTGECLIGWMAHYAIGATFGVSFVLLSPDDWLLHPTPLPALAFGIATVVVPWVTVQPALGLGIASSRARDPAAARLRSLATHTVFGAGLYLGATVLGMVW